jgi:ectoine hydroxylase-related dioxygenase (phytanoyl-CoA dioxygenase family)
VPLYLDPLDADTGALRVIPGSHRRGSERWRAHDAAGSVAAWGIPGTEVPCVAFPSRPGDAVAMDTNVMHASFGGGKARRMLALQFWTAFRSADQYAELDRHMGNWAGTGRPIHSELLHRSAPPSRRPHILQVGARHAVHPRYQRPPWLPDVIDPAALADQPASRRR